MPQNDHDAIDHERRALLAAGVAAGALALMPLTAATAAIRPTTRRQTMGYFTTRDGVQLYYKDWGQGPVVVLSHG
jgi:non-heme chloroperoxidase